MSKKINDIFSMIYEKYDLYNRLMSFGVDTIWRKQTAKEVLKKPGDISVLDVATGTGDLAICIYKMAKKENRNVKIIGMDFNKKMLGIAVDKAHGTNIKFELGDALKMKYANNSFDVVTSAFALRNLDSLDEFAQEVKRVLKSGGNFAFVDMSSPKSNHGKLLFNLYSKFMILAGSIIYKDAYKWLAYSISHIDDTNLPFIMKKMGFRNVKTKRLLSDIAYIVYGTK